MGVPRLSRSPGLRALQALGDRGLRALARGSSCPAGPSLRPVGCPQVGPLLPRSPKNPVLPSGLYTQAFVSGVRWGRGTGARTFLGILTVPRGLHELHSFGRGDSL